MLLLGPWLVHRKRGSLGTGGVNTQMAVIIFAIMYGLLLYALLGGFLLTVCTDFPENLREHRDLLKKTYRNEYLKIVLICLWWYIITVAAWPWMVRKYHV